MRAAYPFILAIVEVMVMSAAIGAGSTQVSLDGTWDFTWTPSSVEEMPELPPDSAWDSRVAVPGRIDDQWDRLRDASWWDDAEFATSMGPVRYLYGTCWYRRAFDAPGEWQGRAVRLTVGWGVGVSHIWLNGEHIDRYDYGVYTPHTVDLSEDLRFGEENVVVISLDNTKGFAGGWAFIGNAGRATGITRPVTLDVAAGPGHISDIYVRPGADLTEVVAEVSLQVPVDIQQAPASRLQWRIVDADDASGLASGVQNVPGFDGARQVRFTRPVDDIEPWSPDSPKLYWLELRWLTEDDVLWDEHRQRFGLRRWSNQGRRLLLNGEPIYLRGEFGAYYYPIHVTTPTTREFWRRYLGKAQELGFNYVNFAARVCPSEMLEVADEMGIVLQCGDHMTVLQQHRDHYREVWEPIVRSTRSHPSMCIYGFGGERNYYEGIIEQFQRQYDLIKSLHPECLVMPQQAIRGIDYAFDEKGKEELTPEPFPHHAERLERYTEASDIFGHYSGGAFGYTYFDTPWREMERRFEIYSEPISIHELFMGMTYINPDNAHNYTGRVPPYPYQKLREDLIEAGLLHKWRTYYENSCRLQARCQKYCVEKTRKCNEPSAFEYLGMIDNYCAPHYTPGMVDEFLQMKPGRTAEQIRQYNSDSVLLIDYDEVAEGSINRSFWAGDAFRADVMLSLFGDRPIEEGTLTWRLREADEVLLGGESQLSDIERGRVSIIDRLEFNWPTVGETTRVNLSLSLSAPGYDLTNDWDFWIFPRLDPPPVHATLDESCRELLAPRYELEADGDLRIVSELSVDTVDYLAGGGRVLLLGTEPFYTHTGWKQWRVGLASRSHHNVGTVIKQHPIFADLPHEGWGDWQFYPVLEGAPSIVFDETIDTTFGPILEVMSCGADVRKQAAIFEKQVGEGRLLVSTCVFDAENPSCCALMDGLVRYVQSDHFQPQHELAPETLRMLAGPGLPVDTRNLIEGAPGFESNVRQHWETYGHPYDIDREVVHTGEQALRISIEPEQLANDSGYYTGASLPTIQFPRVQGPLRISAWHKTQNLTGTEGRHALIFVYIRYMDGGRYTMRMFFRHGTHDWEYAEKVWEPEKPLASAKLYIGIAHESGTMWVDDVYFGFGDAKAPTAVPEESKKPAVTWHSEPVEVAFDEPRWYSINGGEWKQGTKVRIAEEGIAEIATRPQRDEGDIRRQRVGIDITPPVLQLTADPNIDQRGGLYEADTNTKFSLTARDELSGVSRVQISIDGEEYRSYNAPFTLTPGTHDLRCRATDNAGNVSNAITSSTFTHGTESLDVLQIRVQ